jgi:hypothetical protein
MPVSEAAVVPIEASLAQSGVDIHIDRGLWVMALGETGRL